ncbi:MAG: recombinase family protein [Hyphomicrobium sp.]
MSKRTTASKSTSASNKVLAYARVSSKEQEAEGFSIAAQLKLLQSYAASKGLVIEKEYIDVETAKATGRANFTEMVAHIKKHGIRTVLVEKTDRLYRNLKDWVLLDELQIEIHLVKEGVVLSQDSKSSEKFFHGIKVLMAKNYIDNLSEEARKGQLEKAEQGIWPTKAPLGYRNVLGPDGKRIIAPDPDVAPIIAKLFQWYATGTLTLQEVAEKARAEGLVYRRTGAAVPVSAVHTVLHNRTYTGEFVWKGKIYKGNHTPLIDIDLFERVQNALHRRHNAKVQRPRKDFAFSSLIHCGHCGCALSGDIKKGRYVYYRCTGYRGRCPEPYVREEVLAQKYTELLHQLDIGEPALRLVAEGLKSSHVDQAKEHAEAIRRLQAEYDRIQTRIQAMYVDKLDGKVEPDMFEGLSMEWRRQQDKCLHEIQRRQSADQHYLEEGVTVLEMAGNARQLFDQETPAEKRRLLNFVVSNSTWANGELKVTMREPFGFIAEMAKFVTATKAGGSRNLAAHSGWLGD